MKKRLLVPIFLLGMQSPKAQTFNPLLATMLQDTLNFYTAAIPTIKGMSVAVSIPGQGTWKGTTGISFTGQPIASTMQFGFASNTKLFVAAMLLKLAEKNIIQLTDPLSNWLPAYPNINSAITIRQLLNHTSGISDPFFVAPWMDTIIANPTRVFTPHEVLGWVGAPLFAPGASWGYSNINYVLAGMIAENASGYHISRLIRDSILTPLNLDSTFYDVQETVPGTIAHRWWNTIDHHDTSRVGLNTAGGAAGAIFSTPDEMTQWYQALFNGQILNPASMAALTSFVSTTSPTLDYGLGLSREITLGKEYWGHGGSTWGYRSKIIYDTCMRSVVCGVTNAYPSGNDAVTFLLYRVLLNHLPSCIGLISGITVVTPGQNAVVYTVPPIANATSYLWTLPSGATGISNTNSITVDYGLAAVSGTITVQGVNSYGASETSSLPIVVTSILPVQLTRFAAAKQGTKSLLSWTTASEQNTDRFIIENSTDNQLFREIGTVLAKGNTATERQYSYIHVNPSGRSNYYRLKIIDRDGSYSYSTVRMLNHGSKETTAVIYPNPVQNELIIEGGEPGKIIKVKIANQAGQLLFTGNGTGKIRIPTAAYPPGIYFIQLESEKGREIKKFVKE